MGWAGLGYSSCLHSQGLGLGIGLIGVVGVFPDQTVASAGAHEAVSRGGLGLG